MNRLVQPSPRDLRDRIAALPQAAQPTSVDLKADVFEVENQLAYNACTANAGCSALELMYKAKGRPVGLSRMYLYYAMRELEGTAQGDLGAYPRDIGRALLTSGTCKESVWGYTRDHLTAKPTAEVDAQAAIFKINSYERVMGLKDIFNALAQGVPVLLTIALHAGVYQLVGPWQKHNWNYTTSPTNPVIGYHEVLVIGYDDASQRLLVENSWGSTFGDGGFFGIPYDMADTPAFGETWILNPNYDAVFAPDTLPAPAPAPYVNTMPTLVYKAAAICIALAVAYTLFVGK
jgi:Papain family cysteine protease